MRRWSRGRRVGKWAGLVLTVLLAIGCLPWFGVYMDPMIAVVAGRGQFTLDWRYEPAPAPPIASPSRKWWFAWFSFSDLLYTNTEYDNWFTRHVAYAIVRRQGSNLRLEVVLWAPLLISGCATAWLWRRDRRPPKGHCQRCGYDLTGNVSGVCPECGMDLEQHV